MLEDIEQDSGVARQPCNLRFLALLASLIFVREGIKAGIFKSSTPAFSVNQVSGPAEVMRKRALEKDDTLMSVSIDDPLPTDDRVLSVPV
jgi:folylpolyglutamate synthase